MTTATKRKERKLSNNQIKVLKALKRKPHTSKETAELLNNAANRRSDFAFKTVIHTYDSTHACLRRLEDREYVRCRFTSDGKIMMWELTAKGRDAVS